METNDVVNRADKNRQFWRWVHWLVFAGVWVWLLVQFAYLFAKLPLWMSFLIIFSMVSLPIVAWLVLPRIWPTIEAYSKASGISEHPWISYAADMFYLWLFTFLSFGLATGKWIDTLVLTLNGVASQPDLVCTYVDT